MIRSAVASDRQTAPAGGPLEVLTPREREVFRQFQLIALAIREGLLGA